jgi:predicted transcriptional regulator
MSEIEKVPESGIMRELRDIEDAGIMHVKGYSYNEIASLLSITVNKAKEYVKEYKLIIQRQADEDPYFLEKIQFNTIKALQEFDQISKEAWETVNIATDHGIVAARIQALKLAADVANKKAQLHRLMGGGSSTDGEYIARMQKAENVNQILSKILRDVIAKHPSIADEVRRELEVAFEIMNGEPASIPVPNKDYIDQDDIDEEGDQE